jgi:hypothetical protein
MIVEAALAVGGCHVADLKVGGKPCSSSSRMWLTAALGGVIGGVAVIWILVPSALRMRAFIVPFCECLHETATVDAFGVANSDPSD